MATTTTITLQWAQWLDKYVPATIDRLLSRLEAAERLYLDVIDREELVAECVQRAGLLAHDLAETLDGAVGADGELVSERTIVCTACRYAVRMVTARNWIADRVTKPSRVRIAGHDVELGSLSGPEYSERDYEQFAGALGDWIESRREDNGLGYSVWRMRETGYAVWEAAAQLGIGKSKAYEALKEFERSIEGFARDYSQFVL